MDQDTKKEKFTIYFLKYNGWKKKDGLFLWPLRKTVLSLREPNA
jgi:hypothetical protein